jgi:hypothetical protein
MEKFESRISKRYYRSFVLDSERLKKTVAILEGGSDNFDKSGMLEFEVVQSSFSCRGRRHGG